MKPELLKISPNWRDVVLSQIYCQYYISLSSEKASYAEMAWLPAHIERPGNGFMHLVKHLTIYGSYEDILNGTALQEIQRILPDRPQFQSVRVLHVSFEFINEPSINVSVEHAQQLVEHIKYMVPGVIRVVLEGSLFQKPMDANANISLGALVKGLYGLVKDIEYKGVGKSMPAEIGYCVMTGLTRIKYESLFSKDTFIQMIRNSASSLQALTIKFPWTIDLINIVHDEHGNTIVYPNVRQLKLDSSMQANPARPIFTQDVIFPSLEQLHIPNQYPFGDDTLFRGNSKTLEYLAINVDTATTMDLLNRCSCFKNGSPMRLRHLAATNLEYESEALMTRLARFSLDLAPGLETLNIGVRVPSDDIISGLISIPQCKTIRILALPYNKFNVFEVLQLVQTLPLLTNLDTELAGTSQYPEVIKKGKLPLHVYKNYYPASQSFKQLVVNSYYAHDAKGLAISVMLIAIACPNFTFVAMQDNLRHEYNNHLKKMIKAGAYAKYADRLRSLILEGM